MIRAVSITGKVITHKGREENQCSCTHILQPLKSTLKPKLQKECASQLTRQCNDW